METSCKRFIDSFTEYEEVKSLIDLCVHFDPEGAQNSTVESIFETWVKIFDRYQEQPHLIDHHVKEILISLLEPVYRRARQGEGSPSPCYHSACNFIYHVSKVRGFKNFVHHFPHGVTDLEIVIDLLSKEATDNPTNWTTRYVLLLWSSLLVTLPFDFNKFDSQGNDKKPLMERLHDLIKANLIVSDTPRIAAAVAYARFITRHDVSKLYLSNHISWCLNVIDEVFRDPISLNVRIGLLLSLAYIFKLGKREDVSPYAQKVLARIIERDILSQSKNLLAKIMVKIAQRAGLSLLPVKIASWRYSRGRRSILDSLKDKTSKGESEQGERNNLIPENDDDDYQVPEEIENVMSFLIEGLRYNSNLVRWSAAKGVGRLTERLPLAMAGEVVSNICELLVPCENDNSWHGGCLALAELARRGLILPEQLKEVVPKIVKASVYEESRGNFSVGETVRDAACYAFWAFARAYDAAVLRSYLDEITSALLVVSVFDREIRCRKAASAAYQETVGRLGSHNVPHGIEILTTVDNQAVGRIRRAFLELSVFVAQFNNHLQPLIFHLLDSKINHWDQEIRSLSGEALSYLIKLATQELIVSSVVPTLLDRSCSSDLNTKHGAIVALAWVIKSMKELQIAVPSTILTGIEKISNEIKASLGFHGVKGELFRSAICLLIKKVSQANLPLDRQFIQTCWLDILKDCVFHTDQTLRDAAIEAYETLHDNYSLGPEIHSTWFTHLTSNCKNSLEHVRCGSLEALGRLPQSTLSNETHVTILETLLSSLKSHSPEESKWFLWKVSCINCYTALLMQMDNPVIHSLDPLVQQVIDHTLNVAMEDYTTSSKGDVGEPVRMAAIISIKKIILHFHRLNCKLLTYELFNQSINRLLVHCVSHHNEMRSVAGDNFFELIHSLAGHFPMDHLLTLLPSKESLASVHLRDETNFPIWMSLLPLTQYTASLWKGLVLSTGGIPSSIVKLSLDALLNQLQSIQSTDGAKFKEVIEIFISVYSDNLSVERMCLPLINTLHSLVNSGILDTLEPGRVTHLIDLTWSIAKTTAIPKKKIAMVQLCCSCLRFKGLKRKCINILCIFLCTKYPFVRAATADELYTALMIHEELFEGDTGDEDNDDSGAEARQEKALELLTETDWNKDRSLLIPVRDQLKGILGL